MTVDSARFVLSPVQERLWRLPAGPRRVVVSRLRLADPVPEEVVRRALEVLVDRHEALRTLFPPVPGMDLPGQWVADRRPLDFAAETLDGVGGREALEDGWNAAVDRRWEALAAHLAATWDPATGPTLAARLLNGPEAPVLLLATPVVVADPASHRVLAGELAAGLGDGSPGPDGPDESDEVVQCIDASEWQRELLASDEGREGREHWRRRLGAAPLGADWPGVPSPGGPDRSSGTLPGRAAALRRLHPDGTAPVLAAWLAVLRRHLEDDDLAVGVLHAGRKYEELAGLVGCFSRHLPLPFRVGAERSFADLVDEVAAALAGAGEWEEYFAWVAAARDLELDAPPVLSFLFEMLPEADPAPPGLRLEQLEGEVEPFLLKLSAELRGDALRWIVRGDPQRLPAGEVERLGARFATLLAAALEEPSAPLGDLPLLAPAETAVLRHWQDGGPEVAPPAAGLGEAFAARAAAAPDAVALVDGDLHLSFGQVERRSRHLARRLVQGGVAPEHWVLLALERGADQLLAALAVLRAGAAFVPLDPHQPELRTRRTVEEGAAAPGLWWLTAGDAFPPPEGLSLRRLDLAAEDPAAEGPEALPDLPPPSGERLAYVLFTSGSTGRPKGVMVRHRSVLALAGALEERVYASLGPVRRVGLNANLFFDASVKQWVQWLHGRTVWLVPDGARRDGTALLELLVTARPEVLDCTPSQLQLLLAAGLLEHPSAAGTLLLGGEAVPPPAWRALAEHRRLGAVNVYGPTETTVDATAAPVAGSVPTLGRPLPGWRVRLVDRRLQPVPPGVVGEMAIAGSGLARGYAGHPARTAAAFVPDPEGDPGARLYLSGDLARWSRDGTLEYVGRRDHQVKLRGFRIELEEVAAALAEHPGVAEAVAVVAPGNAGEGRLVGYLAPRRGVRVEADDLAAHLARRLPSWAVPAAYVVLDRLPLTRNGKVDRAALPSPEEMEALEAGEVVAPRTPFEEMLEAIWRELLGVERVGVDRSFFDLGGHSLLATQLVARVRQVFQVELPLRYLFEEPTVRQLAVRIAERLQGEGRAPLPAVEPLPRRDGLPAEPPPASFGQERLWFLERLEAGSPLYNLAASVAMEGDLDEAAFLRALGGLVRRHEVLRTTLAEGEGTVPVQRVSRGGAPEVRRVDLAGLPAALRDRELEHRVRAEAARPFDLAAGPLLRVLFFRLAPRRWRLVTVLHHAISDAWSVGVLYRDLAALYRAEAGGAATDLPALPVQYADYAAWQRRHLDRAALAEPLAWWRRHLEGDLPVLALPTDRPRPARPTFRGALRELFLSPELEAELRILARRQGVTLFMVLLAAWGILLRRWSGQRELTVGVPVANRDRVEIEALVGFFVNTVVLRLEVPLAVSPADLLAAVREEALGVFAHQEVPFETLVEALNPDRHLGASPLFQVLYMHQNTPRQPLRLPGLTFGRPRNEARVAPFDLSLMTVEEEDGLLCQLEYSRDLFDATTAERLLRGYRTLLAGLVGAPEAGVGELPLLTPAERQQVVAEWNDTARPLPAAGLLHELVVARGERSPDAVALSSPRGDLAYGDLVERARRLARRLAAAGVGPEVPVAVFLDRVPELAVAHLAVLMAGGACLPLDPDLPAERLSLLLTDAAARLVLTRDELAERLPASPATTVRLDRPEDLGDAEREPLRAAPGNVAYAIYTSGSTGRPKAVAVPHRGLVNYVADMVRRFRLTPRDRVLQFAALSFDVVLEELYPAWAAGAAVVLEPSSALADPTTFGAVLERTGSTVCELPASYWHDWMGALLAHGGSPPECLRLLILGSEKPAAEMVRAWEGFGVGTLYIFGLTETSVTSSLLPLPSPVAPRRGYDLPIGRPTDNTSLLVLDGNGEPAPVGVPGELYVGGEGVARGYLGRPALTASRFVPDAFSRRPGARLYRTGDRVRWLAVGMLDFLGRADHQINLRGLRIEPGEVEAALESHEAVREAVVGVRTSPAGGRVLVAWVAIGEEAGGGDLQTALRRAARRRLPEGMVPGRVVALPSLPRTPHGKVDRRALPDPEWAPGDGEAARPGTPLEELVAGLWSELLEVDRVGPESDFFALGGHSLLATRLLTRVRRTLGVEPPLRRLFEAPRLADFVAAVEEERRRGSFAPPPFQVAPPEAPIRLSYAQRRLWYLHRLQPDSVAYNMPSALRLRGDLSVASLQATLAEVLRRHRVLRTAFGEDPAEPRPRVAAATLPVPVVDLSRLAPEAAEVRARELAHREAVRPLDLDRGPVVRACLVRLGADDHVLLLSIHHIAFDAWSATLLLDEVRNLYPAFAAGRPSPLAELPAQYQDYAHWQRSWLKEGVLASFLEHWRQRLEGLPESPLPTDRPRPEGGGERGANLFFELPAELAGRLRTLSRNRGTTLFMTLLAAFDVLLWHASGRRREDVVVGTDVANRTVAESEAMIGFFVNQLVLRSDLSGAPTFTELLERVRGVTLDAYEHQDLPFDELVRALRPERQVDRHPLFQVKLVLQNAAPRELELPGLQAEPVRFDRGVAKFDLLFDLEDTGTSVEGRAEYNAGLFQGATVRRLVEGWRRLLELAVERPEAPIAELADALSAAESEDRRSEESRLAATSLRKLKRRRSPAAAGKAEDEA